MKTQIKHYASGAKYMVDGKAAPKAAYNAACAANVLSALHSVASYLTEIPKAERKARKAASKVTHCPHCNIDLSNGVAYDGDEVNGVKVFHKEFDTMCLACGGEFGKPVADRRGTWVITDRAAAIRPRKYAKGAVNPRVLVLEAWSALPQPFSKEAAYEALKGMDLGSGSAGMYWRKFQRRGYIAEE